MEKAEQAEWHRRLQKRRSGSWGEALCGGHESRSRVGEEVDVADDVGKWWEAHEGYYILQTDASPCL